MPAFSVSITDRGVAVLTLDLPGESVNKLGSSVSREFEEALLRIRDDAAANAVVLISGKTDTFIVGADIEEFTRLRTREEAVELSRMGQEMIDRLERFPKPIVVAIHGPCVGLGLELSLACAYRIATDHPKTVLGLPEVQIGILPSAGGCQRLPRAIGARAALDIILAGKSERAAKALKIGLVDEVVPASILRDVALCAAERLARESKPRRRALHGWQSAVLDRNPIGRRFVYRAARLQVLKKTGGHYPAPLAALNAVRAGLEGGMEAGLTVEREAFGDLAVSPVARQLVRIFFATNALKKEDGVEAETAAHPREVRRLGIIGAGFMGAGIAGTVLTTAGIEVRLKDADLPRVGKGIKAATDIVAGHLKRRRIARPEYERLTALLSGTAGLSGFQSADLVIEAVFEDLETKRAVLAELERVLEAGAVFATNTSTIPIERIGAGARHPERVLGMHFFSPVDRMPLLEVIPSRFTSTDATVTAVRFGRRMGKTVIVVADRPGFWVNRIVAPYMREVGELLREGVPIEIIDRTMTRYGFPVGPVTLADEVGIDVAQKAGIVMHEAFGERLKPSDAIDAMVNDGRLGRKSGRGFYLYHDGHKTDPDPKVYRLLGVRPLAQVSEELVERRLISLMLNEAAMAAGDGVIRQPRDGDIGAIFGIGFPPFRGGPLRSIDALGADKLVDTLNRLAAMHGARYAPAPALVDHARSGRTFYRD